MHTYDQVPRVHVTGMTDRYGHSPTTGCRSTVGDSAASASQATNVCSILYTVADFARLVRGVHHFVVLSGPYHNNVYT